MKTHRVLGVLAACACLLILAAVARATSPTPKPTAGPPLSASEKRFVDSVTRDLQHRFATTADAAKAGYFRFTDEDETGAISWVNTSYWKSDPQHPAQLWYDANGRLIGVDIALPKADSPKAPAAQWGVSQSRWIEFGQHVHYGIKMPDGSVKFGGYGAKSARKIGSSLSHPTAADVVKLGMAKTTDDVAFVFEFPAIWDLEFWLVPNPLGPFAEKNPNVHPSSAARSSM